MSTMGVHCDHSLPLLQLSATNSMHAELIEDDGESRYKVTDIIGKPRVYKIALLDKYPVTQRYDQGEHLVFLTKKVNLG